MALDYGVHLPVIDFGFQRFSLERLAAYVKTAAELGFKAVSTNDHLIHSRPCADRPHGRALSKRKHGSRDERNPANRTWSGAIG
jgi:hypothetical protein